MGIFVTALTREKIFWQSTAVLSLYKHSRFVSSTLILFRTVLSKEFYSVLEERFPEIKSLNEHQSLARSHKSVAKMCSPAVFAILSIGLTKSICCNSVDPCWQISVPDRLFIPSPCHNFGCVL